ncbi:MAG: (d)CMP kinase, partial [Calditrichaeota bacterium]|nr:(d)CMP kinase [Calditrichota bacterium]
VTLAALRQGVDLADPQALAGLARQAQIRFEAVEKGIKTILDGRDVSDAIRTAEVTDHIKPIASNPGVREALVAQQRRMGASGGVVMDGRDITTVVFPDAELKIFMEASAGERARRRVAEMQRSGLEADYPEILAAIERRDHDDTHREFGPLRRAEDALSIDTTGLSIEEQVEMIYRKAREILGLKD